MQLKSDLVRIFLLACGTAREAEAEAVKAY